MSLGVKVAKNPNISYVTYGGNKQVCTGARITQQISKNLFKKLFLMFTKCPKSLQQLFSWLSEWGVAV